MRETALLVLTEMAPDVYDVYELMEFSSILKSYSNMKEALEYFNIKNLDERFIDPLKGLKKGEEV